MKKIIRIGLDVLTGGLSEFGFIIADNFALKKENEALCMQYVELKFAVDAMRADLEKSEDEELNS